MPSWEIVSDGELTRVALRDTIGIADAGALRLALLEVADRGTAVEMDCAGLAHLDCAAAQVLIAFGAAMRRRQLSLTWTPLPDGPREYLALTGLIDHFVTLEPAEECPV